jgi:hypothetical protein
MAKEQVRAAFRGSDGPEASRAEPDVHSYLLVRRVSPLVKHLFGGIVLLKKWGSVGPQCMVGAQALSLCSVRLNGNGGEFDSPLTFAAYPPLPTLSAG